MPPLAVFRGFWGEKVEGAAGVWGCLLKKREKDSPEVSAPSFWNFFTRWKEGPEAPARVVEGFEVYSVGVEGWPEGLSGDSSSIFL